MNYPGNKAPRPPKFGGVSVLIIEDNPDHLYLIKLALEKCMPGIKAVYASDSHSALSLLRSNNGKCPKLILLDLYLPTRNQGIVMLKALKEHFQTWDQPPVPIVMFSYSDQTEDIRLCYGHGANAYLIKSPDHSEWIGYFAGLRDFWLETAALPPRPTY